MQEQPRLTKEQQELVESNKSLVYFVARRFRHIPIEDYNDLCSRLYGRLCRSICEWKPELGFKLSSYVVKCLAGEAKNYFRDDIWSVKPPRRLRENSLSELLDAVEGSPSAARIQGEDPDKIRTCALPLSLEEPSETDGEEFIAEVLVAADDVEREILERVGENQLLQEIFEALRPDEQYILDLLMQAAGGDAAAPNPIQEVMDTYAVSRMDAQAVIAELQEKVQGYYRMVYADERVPESSGSAALTKALRKRWVPPALEATSVRDHVTTERG